MLIFGLSPWAMAVDRSHIRFFTPKDILEIFKDCGHVKLYANTVSLPVPSHIFSARISPNAKFLLNFCDMVIAQITKKGN